MKIRLNEYEKKYAKEKFHLNMNLKKFQNFENITDERRQEIIDFKNKKYPRIIQIVNPNDLYFYLLFFLNNNNNRLNKDFPLNTDEKIIFLIECIDPDLEILQIYEWECNINAIKSKIFNKFGFFDINLINFEKRYSEKFKKDVVTFLKK